MQANERCIAEVGRIGHLHSCGRKAHFKSERTVFVPRHGDLPMTLYYCKRHELRAHMTDSQIVKVVRVIEL